jgi:hypothetical protein
MKRIMASLVRSWTKIIASQELQDSRGSTVETIIIECQVFHRASKEALATLLDQQVKMPRMETRGKCIRVCQ